MGVADTAEATGPRPPRLWPALIVAGGLAATATILSLALGPVAIAPDRVLTILGEAALGGVTAGDRDAIVLLDIRLPRTVLALLVGAATAVSGAVMQGLFRNPLADPSLVGVSSGAALFAALWFVFGSAFAASVGSVGLLGLPVSAFIGGFAMALILHLLATRDGNTSVVAMLLAGIALTGLATALTGLLVFLSTDQQLREFTFWTLGSLGGATWIKIGLAAPFVLALLAAAPFFSRAFDAVALGEREAFLIGIDIETVKRLAIVGVAAAVGASVAVSGVIAFFGLTVPHLVRLALGPGHRRLFPVAALAGAALLTIADLFARTVARPAELPLGVVTAALGAPLMLYLLARRRRETVG